MSMKVKIRAFLWKNASYVTRFLQQMDMHIFINPGNKEMHASCIHVVDSAYRHAEAGPR